MAKRSSPVFATISSIGVVNQTEFADAAKDLIDCFKTKASLVNFLQDVCGNESVLEKPDKSLLIKHAQRIFNDSSISFEKDVSLLQFLAALYDLNQLSRNLECEPIVDKAYLLLEAERVSIFVYDENVGDMLCLVSKDIQGESVPGNAGIIGYAFKTLQVVNCSDVSSDERHYRQFDEKYEPKYLLCAPIILPNGKPIGVIQALRSDRSFSPEHVSNIQEICPQIAQMISTNFGSGYSDLASLFDITRSKLLQLEKEEGLDAESKLEVAEVVGLLSKCKGDLMKKLTLGNADAAESSALSSVFLSGIAEEELFSWTFDVLKLETLPMVCSVAGNLFSSTFNLHDLSVHTDKFASYIITVQENYRDNPFHNFRHCVTVTHFACMLSKCMEVREKLGVLQHFAVIFSAFVHDIDHPGNTNGFEVNSQSARALLYNDQSVLENHHCSTAFRLMDRKGLNFLSGLSQEGFREFRKMVIACIMATDMAFHFDLCEEFKKKSAEGKWAVDNLADQLLLGKLVVHSADLSNPVRPFAMTRRWAELVSEEFNAQVVTERTMGLPVLPFMIIPDVPTLAKNEMNFSTFVVAPMWQALGAYYEDLGHLISQLDSNYTSWKSLLDTPPENK
jgi:hypothetical protein